ncbi:MAG: MotA/TolQ/ExbB proton channel family protein [Thermodesulfobacteriota bacterium]
MNPLVTIIVSVGIFLFLLPIIRHTGPEMFFNLDALLIIFSGTLIGLFVGFPTRRIRMAWGHIKEAFQEPGDKAVLVKDIMWMARMYIKGEIREIENHRDEIRDEYFKLGMRLLINQHSMEEIYKALERESRDRSASYLLSQNVLKTLAKLTPALGLAGTIISLIKMFDKFQSIETITPLMAVALMSTFYGVIISNLIMLPLSSKLKERAILNETMMEMSLEGLFGISQGEHPLKIEERLVGLEALSETSLPQGADSLVWGEVKINS